MNGGGPSWPWLEWRVARLIDRLADWLENHPPPWTRGR